MWWTSSTLINSKVRVIESSGCRKTICFAVPISVLAGGRGSKELRGVFFPWSPGLVLILPRSYRAVSRSSGRRLLKKMPTLNENIDLPPLRRSRRARSLRNPSQNDRQGGPTKSKYFDDCGTGSSSHDDVESDSSEEETHIYARKQDDTEDVEEEEEYAYLKQNKRKPAFSPQKAKKKAKSTAGGSGTAQEVFIPHCNPLEDSIDIEYKDDTIHPNTIAFLKGWFLDCYD